MAYTLPSGVISEARDHMNMLGDFIAWMDKDGLFEAMRVTEGNRNWSPDDYYVSCEYPSCDDSEFASALFDAMRDLTPLLPEGHMWGWSDGKFGIFECRIKIIVDKPEPKFKFLYADPGFCRAYYRALYGQRLAWLYVHGYPIPDLIDHRDTNRSNNAIKNLRAATPSDNQANRGKNANNTSGYKGVSLKRPSKWRAQIQANGLRHTKENFSTPEEAHEWYCKMAKELHGEFSNTT